MISSLRVGVSVMLNNDRSGNTRVLDSSPVKCTAQQIVVVSLMTQYICNDISFPG
jgi:hypothetical protein